MPTLVLLKQRQSQRDLLSFYESKQATLHDGLYAKRQADGTQIFFLLIKVLITEEDTI
jgi:hypothetical protein